MADLMRRRGAIATARHRLAAAVPYRMVSVPPAQFITIPSQLSYWYNNVDGDCVTAEEAFAKAAYSVMMGQPELFISDATVLAWAKKHGVLNGADILQVIQMMESTGFSQSGATYTDGTPSSVDWTNTTVLQSAISQGPVKIGVAANQLEKAVGQSNGWFGLNFKNDQNTDHCVSLCGYGTIAWLAQQLKVSVPSSVDGTKPAYALFTWNTIGIIDVASMVAITSEAWLRSPTTPGTPVPPPPPPAPVVPIPTVPYEIALGGNVAAGAGSMTDSTGAVVPVNLSSPRAAGTYVMTVVQPLPTEIDKPE